MPKRKKLLAKNKLLEAVNERTRRGFDTIIVVAGPAGMGKSVLAQSLAAHLDPTFTEENWRERSAIADSEDFSQKLGADVLGPDGKRIDGAALVGDEMGVFANSLEFQTKVSRALNKIFQVRRVQKRVIILCMITLPEVLKGVRSKVHFFLEVQNRNEEGNTFLVSIREVDIQSSTGKVHFRVPRWQVETDTTVVGTFGWRIQRKPKPQKFSTLVFGGIPPSWRDAHREWDLASKRVVMSAQQTRISDGQNLGVLAEEIVEKVLADPEAYKKTMASGDKKWSSNLIRDSFRLHHKTNLLKEVLSRIG